MARQDRLGRILRQRNDNENAVEVLDGYTLEPQHDTFRIVDTTDVTKKLAFDASGLTTATTRTLTIPDRSLTLGGGSGTRQTAIAGASNLTLTAALSGSLVLVDGASQAYTLPALDGTTNGVFFDFVVTATSTAVTITAGAGDLLTGGVSIMSTTAGAENDAFSADGVDDLIFTMNGTTKGGIIGSHVRFVAFSATQWVVEGDLIGSGIVVTPFS